METPRICPPSWLRLPAALRNPATRVNWKKPKTTSPSSRIGCWRMPPGDSSRWIRVLSMPNKRSWSTLVQRVGRMSWDELRTRALQEAAKRSDLVLSAIGARFAEEPGNSPSAHCGHFVFEPEQLPSILDFLRRRLPDVVGGIVHQAEQICRHRFDLLGYRSVNYGPEIDWHLDAVHGKRAPWRAWYKVPYLDFDQVGDSKVTWELNRHQHLVTLAKAYRLTGDPQFA